MPVIGARVAHDDAMRRLEEAAKDVGVSKWKMILIRGNNETKILFPTLPLEDDE